MGWAKYMEDNFEIINERLQWAKEMSSSSTEQTVLKADNRSMSATVTEKKAPKRKEKCIICKECGKSIIFSVRDQLFYEKKGWDPPKRCKSCRELRSIRYLMHTSY